MLSGTRSWLRQTATHYPYVAHVDGVPTFGTGVVRKCRIERELRNVINDQGSEVLSTFQLYLDGSTTVSAKDKFVLTDGTLPPIISVGEQAGPRGDIWLKVVFA